MDRPADFIDAHRRHWEDASLLFEQKRWANADQLFGYSAECGLKAIMRDLGMPVDDSGSPENEKFRRHVRDLWPESITFFKRRKSARYLRMLPEANPFADWSHHDRYAHRNHFHKNNVTHHRDAAHAVMTATELGREDGSK